MFFFFFFKYLLTYENPPVAIGYNQQPGGTHLPREFALRGVPCGHARGGSLEPSHRAGTAQETPMFKQRST